MPYDLFIRNPRGNITGTLSKKARGRIQQKRKPRKPRHR